MKLSKRIISMTVMAVMSMAALTGCGNAKDDSIQRIQQNQVIRVAVPDKDSSFLYYDYENEEYAGLDADVVNQIACALGVGVEYVQADSESYTNLIATGQADIAIGMINEMNNELQQFNKSVSYGSDFLYVVTPNDVYPWDLTMFANQEIGIAGNLDSDTSGNLFVIGEPIIYSYKRITDAANDLETGSIKAFFCYRDDAEAIMETGNFRIQNATDIPKENYVILSALSDVSLSNGINIVIGQYLNGVRYDAIEEPEEETTEEE